MENQNNTHASPVLPGERIVTLDIIRGFALLGILIMNIPFFSGMFYPWFLEPSSFTAWERVSYGLREILFSGKFNSMFSLLFAIGFTIQLDRLYQREPDHAVRIYLRRLAVLFGIGLIHAFAIGFGDVLHVYALLGCMLLLVRKLPDRLLVGLIVLCLLYPAYSRWLPFLAAPEGFGQVRRELLEAMLVSSNAASGPANSSKQSARSSSRCLSIFQDCPLGPWP